MSVQIYQVRLFGGHDLGVSYDNVAGTISILGQSILVSNLPAASQAQWQAEISTGGTSIPTGARGAFGGDNIGQVVGNILDASPTWRGAVQAALATFIGEQTLGGQVAGVETFNR